MENILIDYSQIPINRTGVGIYAYNLIDQILKIDNNNKYFILVQNDDSSLEKYASKNVHLLYVNHKLWRIFILRFFLEQFFIPLLLVKKNISIIHSLHYSFPLFKFKAKRIVTIHDMTFFLFPGVHVRLKTWYFRTFIWLASKMEMQIICVSESTLNDLIRIIKLDKTKCFVIPLGKSDIFNSNYSVREIEDLKEKYNIKNDYLLFIGTIEPRKNIERLIRVFNEFLKLNYNYSLVIVGKKGWFFDEIFRLIELFNIKDKIIFTGFVLEEEKPILLNGCKIFIYPSLYEGFGVPVLEALSCGIPSITSNRSSMPEVAGDAAILVDPENESDILKAICLLLSDVNLYNLLKKRSIIQSKKFSWEKTASETLKLYKS